MYILLIFSYVALVFLLVKERMLSKKGCPYHEVELYLGTCIDDGTMNLVLCWRV